ncbi:MAG: beta strand repeat-containing protein, partial [Bacteroidia bacterium]
HTVTIKPSTSVSATIVGSNTTSILRFANGASNYIIDGSNNGTSTQNLVVQNTSTTGSVVMFQGTALNQGVRNTTFKNTLVKAGGNTTASYGIIVGGTVVGLSSGGIGHGNLVIENNNVYNTDYGVVVSGSSVTNNVKNVTLRNNKIGTDSSTLFTRTYGLYLINADSVLVDNNTIFNVKQGGSINNAGIWIASGLTNSTIKRNVIKGIHSTSANGYGAFGINIASGTGVDNDSIYNNLIFDIKTANYSVSSTLYNPFGIRLASGATNLKVFYNTINLYGAPQNGTAASASAPLLILPGTYTGTEIRNNIFSNTTGGLTGSKHYAYWTTTTAAIPGLTFNNNNFFAGGTYGILMNANGTDVNTLALLQTSTGANANSISVNPTFANDTTLIPGLGTVSGLASVISTIDRDYANVLRSATTPTIGAYENAADLSGPSIIYSSIGNSPSVANLVLNSFATITDFSGVDVTTNKPRIYYKRTTDANVLGSYPTDNTSSFNGWKYVEASNAASPFGFTIDYSLLYLTGSVVVGDVIEYFVTAQDLVSTPNVSANPSAGFAATGVNTITSVPSVRNSYTIVSNPLAGTYLVGSAQSAPNFTSLTQAINELNLRGVSAPVTFELTDATYTSTTENFPITVNGFGGMGINNPVTIKPALNNTVSISGSSNQAIFRFNGADYITIDGSATTNNTRDLTIANTSRTANSSVIWLASQGNSTGSIGITVKNTKVQGDTSAVVTTFGIYAAGTTISNSGTGADNDTLTLENNEFTRLGYAIYASGTSTNKNKGTIIRNNTIGNVVNLNTVTNVGIYVMQTNGLTISNNLIKNINAANTGIGDGTVGILLQTGVENATITKNVIDSIIYTGTGGYGGKGIDINTGLASSNILVSNNMISNILGDGWTLLTGDGIVGLRVLGSTGAIKLLHNTVVLSGNANRSSATLSAAVYVASGVTNLQARNNIFMNGIENNLSTSAKAYAIASAITNPATVDINYNNYYAYGSQAVFGFLGADVVSLNDWKATLVQDANSISDPTSFVSSSDLHLTGASISNTIYTCPLMVEVPQDIDGNTRLSFTYMGADEVLNNPVPVKWASFTGAKKVNDASLTWVTASESNNKGFDVQRSFDGRTFETISFVK